jgi:predicted permease
MFNHKNSDLDDEIRAHLQMAARERMERGESAGEAGNAAVREFGNVGLIKEVTREMWSGASLETFLQDVRYGFRMLIKSPGFAIVAVITLALGIGANTAIFSVVNGVLLNPLPFPDANRIVVLFQDKQNFPKGSISYPNFLDWQADNRSFESMAAYRWTSGDITGVAEPESVHGQRISASFFPILGVNPVLGRNFSADEDRRGANPTVMISEGLWKRKFGSDPNIIGQRIIVAGEGRTIIGVVPSSFKLQLGNFRTAELYVPIGDEKQDAFFLRDSFWGTNAIARLKPGVTLEQARADMERVNRGLAAAYPSVNVNLKANIVPLKEEIVGDMRPVLLVLLGAVAFVLLIACVNVANLLLARSSSRQREFAVRVALGAGQVRIVRQVLTESIILAIAGSLLGLILAKGGTVAALAAVPRSVPRAEDIGLDSSVLLFTFGLSLAAGIAFGLIPALRIAKSNVGSALKESGRALAGRRSGAQGAFVVGEMAMALVLLIGAGLMIRTLVRLWHVDAGFDAHNVINFGITPPPSLGTKSADEIRAAYRELHAAISSVPGVEHASFNRGANPMEGDDEVTFWPEGSQPRPVRQGDLPLGLEYVVEPDYLQTMRIPLLRGRFFGEQDNERSAPVAVIDTSFAEKYFPGQDPLGKHIGIFDYDPRVNQRVWREVTVIGVVGHVNQFGLSADSTQSLHAQMYLPFHQVMNFAFAQMASGATVYVRFHDGLNPESFFQTIRQKLLKVNRDIITAGNESEQEIVAGSIARERFSMILLATFAGLALLLASIGIYGVLSYIVGRRTQEIGVRMALGAQRSDVLRSVLGDGVRLALLGAAIGVVASLGLTRVMKEMLFGVRPTDPLTFGAVVVLLCAIALMACYVPARRAMRVDPLVALRYE